MKCKNCKEVFEPKWFNWKFCDKDLCHNLGVKDLVKKEREKKAKQERKEKKKAKEALLTHRDYLRLFQKVFNTYIRLSKERVCISCDTNLSNRKYDASHYRSVGANPSLRFTEDNVWNACVRCNRNLHGNLIEYRIRLVKKIGSERVEDLEREHPPLHLSIPEIKEKIKEYKAKINSLK